MDVLNKEINNIYDKVFHYGDKLLFESKYDKDILIYDTNTKLVKEYKNVLYNYDRNIIYVIHNNGNKITIDKV